MLADFLLLDPNGCTGDVALRGAASDARAKCAGPSTTNGRQAALKMVNAR